MVFPSSVIRKLAPSEEWYAQSTTFGAITLHLCGPFDTDAMSVAFDALLQSHPILAGHLEKGSDGSHQIVTDDLLHPGIWIVERHSSATSSTSSVGLDPSVSLVNLMVRTADGESELTLYAHHSLADGHHLAELLLELFSRYTDVVCTGSAGPASTQPAPESLEALLERRGIRKHRRSGLERFIPAMFAHELPPPRSPEHVGNPAQPVAVPAARGRLTERETTALVEFGQAHRLFLNSLLSAAILLAEWRLRKNPDIPIPYVYVVDLRSLLEPPVPPMGATNPLGMATYLAAIKPTTNLVDLAHDVAEAFQTDLSDGVIQQSMLHFKPQYDEGQRGLPDVVSSTNLGRTPDLRTPPNLEVHDWQTEIYRSSSVFDMYSIGTFGDQLAVERHTYAPEPQRSIDLVLSILRKTALEHQR
jgi:phenolphthiocerol/phthiocerol/phthiodiolone dimycocerosyl transferase